jgi:hypothetical protein
MTQNAREAQLSAALATVCGRIEAAALSCGRAPREVTLVVVTKAFPAADISILSGLGVTDVAENRHQEGAAKVAVCADLPLRWHFVGQLQTNKAASVAAYADVVHSVDRTKLVSALDRGAESAERRVACLVQIDLDENPHRQARGGVTPAQLVAVADAVADAGNLDLRGVMAVAPLEAPAGRAFDRLRQIADDVRNRYDGAEWVSAGMSADFETAIAFGATHVRIGSALLGARPALR